MANRKVARVEVEEVAEPEQTAMSIKMTVAFRGWLNELADHDRSTAAQAMEKGAIMYAKHVGFTKAAPKRTGGR